MKTGSYLSRGHTRQIVGKRRPRKLTDADVNQMAHLMDQPDRNVRGICERFGIIPIPIKNHLCAQSRSPMDIILQGWSMSWFQAKQQ